MLSYALILLAALAPHPSVYVKGYSRAAVRTRAQLQASTCFRLEDRLETADAVLEVSHVFDRSGNPSVVMVLLGPEGKVLWEGKTSEDPWPLPSPVNRLLKRMDRSVCPAVQALLAARGPHALRDPQSTAVK